MAQVDAALRWAEAGAAVEEPAAGGTWPLLAPGATILVAGHSAGGHLPALPYQCDD